MRRLVERAEQIASSGAASGNMRARTQRLDRVLSGKVSGPLLMVLLLFGVLWLTISGANPISGWLESCFMTLNVQLWELWRGAAWPEWLGGLFLDGMFGTTAKVVAVMLPPAAIFFPLFTILEESGYLPRVAYLLDAKMSRSGACGRQALTMCMGCGCNAVGVTGCRIIGSERERLLAILTNSFVPCNGRFPLLIALGTFLFAGRGGSFESAVCLMGCLLLSVWMTFAAKCGAQPDGAAWRAVDLRDGAAALPAAKAARGDRAVADGARFARAGARGDGRGPGRGSNMGVCERTDRRQYAADVDGRSAGAGRAFFRDERYAAAGVCARAGRPTSWYSRCS